MVRPRAGMTIVPTLTTWHALVAGAPVAGSVTRLARHPREHRSPPRAVLVPGSEEVDAEETVR
jgi:hypothetical protein